MLQMELKRLGIYSASYVEGGECWVECMPSMMSHWYVLAGKREKEISETEESIDLKIIGLWHRVQSHTAMGLTNTNIKEKCRKTKK